MTAMLADFELASSETVVPGPHSLLLQRLDKEPSGMSDADCNRYLWLHVALLGPLSAALWVGLGWTGYQLMMRTLG